MSTDEWINMIRYIHQMQYYSTLKRSEILTCATTELNRKDVTLSETSQSQQSRCPLIALTVGQLGSWESETQRWLAGAREMRKRGVIV